MIGLATTLTIVTLAGLIAGFAREWLLVAGWGAGGRTDAFLVAIFLPEVIRTMLAGGLLSSVGIALWNERTPRQRAAWLSGTTASLGLASLAVTLVLALGSPLWIRVIGPGLSTVQHAVGVQSLQLLACVVPGIVLQAWWSVPLQAEGNFLLPGCGSLLFNLPAIGYMLAMRGNASEQGLALGFVAGSILMLLSLLPSAWKLGLSARLLRPARQPLVELGNRILPLLTSSLAGQGLLLVERIVASYLGEGSLTVINLARKLVNVPLVAMTSLNQVVLGLMSRQIGAGRLELLVRGLATVTIVSLPAALGLLLGSHVIVALLFHAISGHERIESLLALYAGIVTFASWNAMIARFNYAAGDTQTPLICELAGNGLQALCIPLLGWAIGTSGVAIALLVGTLTTGFLLVRQPALRGRPVHAAQALVSAFVLGAAGIAARPLWTRSIEFQWSIAALAAALCMALLLAWLRPWQVAHLAPSTPVQP